MDVVTLQAAKAYTLGRSRHQGPASVMAIGDSITANGNTLPTGAADYILGGQSYLWWAAMLSNGGLVYKGVAATGGFNTAQIISTHLPTILAAKPSYCVVHAGTNDNGTLTQAQTFANLKTIYDSLLAAGITPIATTMLPKQTLIGSSAKVLQQISLWITRYASTRNFPCVDWNALLVDPTNGNYTGYGTPGTYNVDNTHPNAAGAKVMGQALWSAIKGWVPPVAPYLPTANPNDASTFPPVKTNALFLTDTNTDGLADNLTLSGTGATASLTAMSASDGLGNWQSVTSSGANTATFQGSSNTAVTAGNRYLFACRIKTANIKTNGAQWNVRFTDSNSVDIFAIRNMPEDVTLGVIWHEFTMPTGTSGLARVMASVATATATLSIGQLMIYDLTAAGILP